MRKEFIPFTIGVVLVHVGAIVSSILDCSTGGTLLLTIAAPIAIMYLAFKVQEKYFTPPPL